MAVTWATPVPPTCDVWMFIGDSTCAGVGVIAEAPVGYPPADTTLYMLKEDHVMAKLSEPCANGGGATGLGPAGLFGWYRQQRVGGTVCIVNCGIGAKKSSEWLQGTTAYNLAVGRIRKALGRPGATLRGIILVDGANDAALAGASSSWQTNWNTTLPLLRSDIGAAAASAPFFFHRLPPTAATYATFSSWAAVYADQTNWASSNRIMISRLDAWSWVAGEERVHLTTAGEVSSATLIDTTVAAAIG